MSPMPDERGATGWTAYSTYAGLGIQFALTFLAFGAIGYALDRWLGTTPWFLIFGIAFGAVGAFVSLISKVPKAGSTLPKKDVKD